MNEILNYALDAGIIIAVEYDHFEEYPLEHQNILLVEMLKKLLEENEELKKNNEKK